MDFVPLLFNLIAVFTGIRAIGDGRDWSFGIRDICKGDKLAMIYLWVIGSTAFALVHSVALILESPIIGNEPHQPFWLLMHSVIGLLFTFAHCFVDAIFADKKLAERVLGMAVS